MDITVVGPVYPYRGGIAHYTSRLVQALRRQGHEVQVVSFRRQYPTFLYPGQTDKDPSADAIRVPAEFLLDPLLPWTWRTAAVAIIAAKPALVVLQWWSTFWAPSYFVLARMLRRHLPVVFLIHNVLPHEAKPWDVSLAGMALRQGRAFVVQAPHEQERLLKLIPGARVRLCTHPVYLPFAGESVPKDAARRRLGLPLDSPVVLHFGIVRPYKGLTHLIEAMRHVAEPLHLVVAGEFWEDVTPYQRLIERLGLAGRVTMIDRYVPNEEAHLLFSAADALAAPYVGGTQSGAVELAIGYGLPAITTERIAKGISNTSSSGLRIVPPADVAALAEALTEIARGRLGTPPRMPPEDDWVRMVRVLEEIGEALSGQEGSSQVV